MTRRNRLGWPSAAAIALALAGCTSGDQITLKDAPPVAIPSPEEKPATSDAKSLKQGAPPRGSSAGLDFNPSRTEPAR